MPHIEREIKFRLPEGMDAARVRDTITTAGFRLEPSGTITHEDRYLDTDDWMLYRAGLALRLREDPQQSRLEAKTLRSADPDALVRREWSQEAPQDDPPWSALPPGPVAALLTPLAGLRLIERLRVRARLRNERETFQWLRDDALLGSLTVDNVCAMNGAAKPPLRFQEVEMELRNGADPALADARRAVESELHLKANAASKLASALAAAGESVPERDERLYAIHPADRFVDVAHKTIARHFGRLLWNEPGARLGLDAEHVHDMRVAGRRLRTAFDLFAPALSAAETEAVVSSLRWLIRALGRVRDADVALQRIEELSAEAPPFERVAWTVFQRSLEIRRARRRLQLIERLDSDRYVQFLTAAGKTIEAGPASPDAVAAGGVPAYAVAPRLVAERYVALDGAYDQAERLMDDRSLHALRLAAKRARYALEFFGDLGAAGAAKRAKRLAELQDFLGTHEDRVVLLRRLKRYARTVPRRDRELTLAVGSALGHVERAARLKRADLRREWSAARTD